MKTEVAVGYRVVLVDIQTVDLLLLRNAQTDSFLHDAEYRKCHHHYIDQHREHSHQLGEEIAALAENTCSDHSPQSANSVNADRPDGIVELHYLIKEIDAQSGEDPGDNPDERSSPGSYHVRPCRNGNESADYAVAHHGYIRLFVKDPGHYHSTDSACRACHYVVERDIADIGGYRQRRAAVEPEPCEPQDKRTQRGHRDIMPQNGYRFTVLGVFTLSGVYQQRTHKGAYSAHHVYRSRACKIVEAHVAEPAAAPDPVSGHRVNYHTHDRRADKVAAQTTTAPPAAETTQSTPEPQSAPEPEKTLAKAEIGDSLLFGTYNGEPIKWRVLRLSEDGTQAVVIAEDILTMKAFDAAEGGTFNKYEGEDYWSTKLSEIPGDIQRLIRGDNRWEYSNIRTWLNSDRENVQYSDQAPTSQAMTEKRNGYHTEPGFLNGFTKAERSALVETDITTNGTVTSDKVFLLSSAELEWLYEADVSVFAKPTAAAVEQDKSGWYKVDQDAYGVDDFFWWLRDAVPDNSCECYYINISYTDQRIASGSAGLEGYGIRPAVTLDLTAQPVIDALETAHETD